MTLPDHDTAPIGYVQRWRGLGRAAWLYLLHAALLTSSLAITSLLFNLAILALGYPRSFLGLLNTLSLAVAGGMSLPLWWLAARAGLRRALVASAGLQAASACVFALWPSRAPLLLASALTGVAAVLFQVSAPPFMMRHSDAASRDHLFSANAAINVGLAGLGSLVGGRLPELLGRQLGVGAESALAYRASFMVAGVGLALSLVPLLLIKEAQSVERRAQNTPSSPTRAPAPGREIPTIAKRAGSSRSKALRSALDHLPEAWRSTILHPKPLLKLLTPPLLISAGAALLIPYLNVFFKDRFALADSALGLIFAALGVTTGLLALAGPLLSRRIGKIRTVALTQALSIPFLLALGFVPLLGVAVGAALARAALFNMGAPLYDAFALERTDEPARPAVIGLINGAYSAGYLVGPLISTRAQERYGFAPLFVATAVCYALAVLANYWFFVRADAAQAEAYLQSSAP
ncbi:MAG TPA: MFS transporter [Roseiflexaceae bacterium]